MKAGVDWNWFVSHCQFQTGREKDRHYYMYQMKSSVFFQSNLPLKTKPTRPEAFSHVTVCNPCHLITSMPLPAGVDACAMGWPIMPRSWQSTAIPFVNWNNMVLTHVQLNGSYSAGSWRTSVIFYSPVICDTWFKRSLLFSWREM